MYDKRTGTEVEGDKFETKYIKDFLKLYPGALNNINNNELLKVPGLPKHGIIDRNPIISTPGLHYMDDVDYLKGYEDPEMI